VKANSRVFVDTNVFVYLRDSRDPIKQARCAEWMGYLWDSNRGRVSSQVLQEYYVTVTGRLRPGLPIQEARDDVMALRAWSPRVTDPDLVEDAWVIQDRWGFSFWDCLIVAAAQVQGCDTLLTEDLSHGQDLEGLLVISPFKVAPPEVAPPEGAPPEGDPLVR
jgi:predicted nucleic acid-binding protein